MQRFQKTGLVTQSQQALVLENPTPATGPELLTPILFPLSENLGLDWQTLSDFKRWSREKFTQFKKHPFSVLKESWKDITE